MTDKSFTAKSTMSDEAVTTWENQVVGEAPEYLSAIIRRVALERWPDRLMPYRSIRKLSIELKVNYSTAYRALTNAGFTYGRDVQLAKQERPPGETHHEYQLRYYQEHKEQIRERSRIWRETHTEEYNRQREREEARRQIEKAARPAKPPKPPVVKPPRQKPGPKPKPKPEPKPKPVKEFKSRLVEPKPKREKLKMRPTEPKGELCTDGTWAHHRRIVWVDREEVGICSICGDERVYETYRPQKWTGTI